MNDLLVLSSTDLKNLVTMEDSMQVMENVFAAASQRRADAVGFLHFDAEKYGGWWSVKPGYISDSGYAGVKLGSGYSGNVAKGLPTILAAILLADATNGMPLAVLDGVYITAIRTGAAGGIAAKYLARKDSEIVGVVGSGVQGRMQALALQNQFDIEEVRVYSRNPMNRNAYAREMRKRLRVSVSPVHSAALAVKGVDILITATPSKVPIIKSAWVDAGLHINAIGADGHGKQEIEKQVYRRAKIVTDNNEFALKKKFFTRRQIYAELGDIIVGRKKGRINQKELTLFDSTGLGIQDVAVAGLVYEKAKKTGVGKWVEFI